MTNHTILLVLVLPVLTGLMLLRVRRSDRRQQFVQHRLHAITAGKDNREPQLSLVRRMRRAAAPLPRKLSMGLDAGFEATGNRIGLLHLVAVGLIAAIVVILFVSRILALNSALVMLCGSVAAAAAPLLLLRVAQSRYQNRFLDVFPDALDLVGRGVKAGLPVNEALVVAGREIADPVGNELRRALDQVQIGVQMVDALQQTTGGSLAETLGNLSKGDSRPQSAASQGPSTDVGGQGFSSSLGSFAF